MISAAPATLAPLSAAPIFAALGEPSRLAIVARLCAEGPLATARLGEQARDVSRQGLTKHLRVLEEAGLVDSVRVGRDRLWQVRPEQLAALRGYLDRAAADWDARLARLSALVEDGASGAGG